MDIGRRNFLAVTGGITTTFVAGCSGLGSSAEDPSFEVRELLQSDAALVSIDNNGNSFSATIQNTGNSGQIAVALFWQMEESAIEPEGVTSGTDGFLRERINKVYFDADERRTVELTAQPPDDAIGYQFLAQAATYGANIQNTGGKGRAAVEFTYNEPMIGIETTEEDTLYIESEATKNIEFDQVIETNSQWNIEVQPVNSE
ncbi:hypothetical protein [Haloarcula argentinensis]|uniref:Uncharacterized protein n=2 Tax=Haloarcula argentinensis TaxID=43776 RepID=A0A830FXF2_HALAR|nr:hypothetical protein [Haloarcula argentinensis]MDS0255797.1 hypothetical protein [Haloarcula argentinensis]GGM51414.1 hypothetical protein GCM10009006_35750 [Haloarcula argentinensis]